LAFTRLARREKEISRAVADDTLGASGAAVKPWKSIVMGNRPYIPCMSPVKLGQQQMALWRFFRSLRVSELFDSDILKQPLLKLFFSCIVINN
jgi:hypothetical protein